MNILVFSDSHGHKPGMRQLTEALRPDRIIHLGDMAGDAAELAYTAPVTAVRGNGDYSSRYPSSLRADWEGVRLLICHGHEYHVKAGLDFLAAAAREAGARLALFGHTHMPYNADAGGVRLFNPGSAAFPRRGAPSYGWLTLRDGEFTCEIRFF